jgi:hypothetical protein
MKRLAFELAKTFACVAATLFLLSQLASAEMIYHVEGIFAPSFTNEVAPSFVGEFVFPDDTVAHIDGWVELTNEPDLPRPISLDMSLNLPGTAFQPWDTRLYSGVFARGAELEPVTMLLVDYDQTAGTSLDASLLEGGGGWDAWNVSFTDYPAGSLDVMTATVNEPAMLGIVAIAGVVLFGMLRSCR